jgi:hypothetical protein
MGIQPLLCHCSSSTRILTSGLVIRRRAALKSVHFYWLHKRTENTKETYPTIVNHIQIEILSMKFIPALKLYNEVIDSCHSSDQSTYPILWKLLPFSSPRTISPFYRVRGIPLLCNLYSQWYSDPLNCVHFWRVTNVF